MGKQEDTLLQWNVVEFVKDVVRLKGKCSILHTTIPGGLMTSFEAERQRYVVLTKKGKQSNFYELTLKGLELYWEHGEESDALVSRAVVK